VAGPLLSRITWALLKLLVYLMHEKVLFWQSTVISKSWDLDVTDLGIQDLLKWSGSQNPGIAITMQQGCWVLKTNVVLRPNLMVSFSFLVSLLLSSFSLSSQLFLFSCILVLWSQNSTMHAKYLLLLAMVTYNSGLECQNDSTNRKLDSGCSLRQILHNCGLCASDSCHISW